MGDPQTPAAGPARLTERDLTAMEQRAQAAIIEVIGLAKGARKWTMCVPVQRETDSDMVLSAPIEDVRTLLDALRAAWAENARYRAALEELVWATTVHGDVTVCDYCGVLKDEPGKDPACSCAPLRAALAAPGAGENGGEA